MSEHLGDQHGRPRSSRCRPGARASPIITFLLLGTACVRWQPVASSDIAARPLPRWVQVTTCDSVHYRLEHARFVPGDSLVGTSVETASSVRLPVAEIAHLEARVPSGSGSIGTGLAVIGGVAVVLVLLGHVSSPTP
jgi:hypothetical protein